jgi:hypothetical protein
MRGAVPQMSLYGRVRDVREVVIEDSMEDKAGNGESLYVSKVADQAVRR